MSSNPASQIIEALPDGALERLGMTARNIRHAKSSGRFSGLWYRRIRDLCMDHGVPCPMDAFNWKGDDTNLGNEVQDYKGSAA